MYKKHMSYKIMTQILANETGNITYSLLLGLFLLLGWGFLRMGHWFEKLVHIGYQNIYKSHIGAALSDN